MTRYEQAIQIIEENFGKGRDNAIALATLKHDNDKVYPVVREVDAFYENGVLYISTSAKSNKMNQIAEDHNVSFSISNGWFNGHGIAKNLGWILDPANAELRTKAKEAFVAWYDFANDETQEDSILLAVEITQAVLKIDHGAEIYHIDYTQQACN